MVPARMGQLVPLALATLIPGGGDAGAAALSCCLHAEPRLQGTETLVNPGGRLTMMGRAICTSLVGRSVSTDRRRLHGWRNGRSCSWPGGSCGGEAGGSVAPSPSSRSRDGRCSQNSLTSWDPQGASVPTGHRWHRTAVPEKWEKKKGLGENLKAGEILGKLRAHRQQGGLEGKRKQAKVIFPFPPPSPPREEAIPRWQLQEEHWEMLPELLASVLVVRELGWGAQRRQGRPKMTT